MNDASHEFGTIAEQLSSLVAELQGKLGGTPVSRKLGDGIRAFHEVYKKYQDALDSDDVDQVYEQAKILGVYGIVTAQGVEETTTLDASTKQLGGRIGALANNLRSTAEHSPRTYKPLDASAEPSARAPTAIPSNLLKRVEQFVYEQEKQDQRIKGSLNENERRTSALEGRIAEIEQLAKRELDKISEAYAAAQKELESKKDQINSILGHASGRTIAGDYEKSAADEKAAANWLRAASLVCMTLIVGVLGYSFWETATSQFDLQRSLFRVALAFLLSAPAAYLARESTKHRVQQYLHLQTSLDLKAITPYLASLPDELQHKIKSDIASRIFAGRESTQTSSESYPVNLQEVMMELIKKVGSSSKATEKS